MNKRHLFLLLVTLLIPFYGTTQNEIKKYIPSEENLKARKWFEAARFGLFVHWGVYSILGDGEWVMNKKTLQKKLTKYYLLFLIQQSLMQMNG